MHTPPPAPRPVEPASQSVAGEEDPGASIDLGAVAPAMAPGDEAPAGTPGTGEDICPYCGGSGRVNGASGVVACPECTGSGRVIRAVGGA